MIPLQDLIVLAIGDMSERPLCRFLASLGATIRGGEADAGSIAKADFLVEGIGLEGLADLGSRAPGSVNGTGADPSR
jgi:hypothetical protein